jgi:molybdate transport system ATP-binding protein
MKLDVDIDLPHLTAIFSCETDALGVVGPSGSGKSTLLHAIAGIEPGRVSIDGRDVTQIPLHHRAIGYVEQDALLFPHLSVRENLTYSPRAEGIAAVAEALDIRDLLDRRPRNLSGGERRRVALARAIAARPELLLLDEPFSGLDEQRRREAMSLLEEVRRRFAIPTILVSHLAEEVIGLTSWAVRLDEGRVTASGPSSSVLRAGETSIDNYFVGEVTGESSVRVGDLELVVPLPTKVSARIRLACYAHDILLATELPRAHSARNVFWTSISSIEDAGNVVLIGLSEPPVRVLVTHSAVKELDLHPGKRIAALIKATSLAYLGGAA